MTFRRVPPVTEPVEIEEPVTVDGSVSAVITDPNDPARQGEFDNLFKAPLTVDIAHHEIHEGDSFSAVLSWAAAVNTDTIEGYIHTPAVTSPQKRMHIVFNHAGTGLHSFTIIEDVTLDGTPGGAAYVPVNRRRDSGSTTAAQAVRAGGDSLPGGNLVYAGGETIWDETAGQGKGVGASTRGTEEWILAPDTEYIFMMTSLVTPAITLTLSATWYEHTDSL